MIFQPDYQKTSHESIQSYNKGYLNGKLDVSHSKLFDILREFTMPFKPQFFSVLTEIIIVLNS